MIVIFLLSINRNTNSVDSVRKSLSVLSYSVETPELHYMDKASVRYGGSYPHNEVAGVKLVFRLFPFLGIMIFYWGIYSQMSTAFQNQGDVLSALTL